MVQVSKACWARMGIDHNVMSRRIFGASHPQTWHNICKQSLVDGDRFSVLGFRCYRFALSSIPTSKHILIPIVGDLTMKWWAMFRVGDGVESV